MKLNLLLLFISLHFFSGISFSQKQIPAEDLDRIADNFGEKKEFMRFYEQEVQYPEESLKKKIGGKVVIRALIKKDGTVSDMKVIKSVNNEIDAEAIRLYKHLLFYPSVFKGEEIDSYVSYEIKFNPKQYASICKKRGYTKLTYSSEADTSIVIYNRPDSQSNFIGGKYALKDYLEKNLEYPTEAKLQNIKGTVILSFVVEKNGMTSNIKVEQSVGGGCDQEAIRILVSIKKWLPASNKGKLVRSKMELPIQFELANSFKDNSHGEQR